MHLYLLHSNTLSIMHVKSIVIRGTFKQVGGFGSLSGWGEVETRRGAGPEHKCKLHSIVIRLQGKESQNLY